MLWYSQKKQEEMYMMGCLTIFLICLVGCAVFAFFLGSLLFHSFWAIVVFAALLLTMFIKLFLYYEDKVEALEKRIALIEKGTPEDTGKEKEEKEMPEQEKQAEETENREENYETAGIDGQPYRD